MLIRRILKKNFSFTPAVLPDLKFDYGELEPVLSARLMEFHHAKHHQTYINNFNKAVEQFEDASAKRDFQRCQSLHKALGFHGGGHVNHSLFWENLAPASRDGGVLPSDNSPLTQAIVQGWGSYENFITKFNQRTLSHPGSGWGWLVMDPDTQHLRITDLHNQETVKQTGDIPLLTVDVWEHAYYLDYKSKRGDFLENIWQVMNWKTVERRYLDAINQNK